MQRQRRWLRSIGISLLAGIATACSGHPVQQRGNLPVASDLEQVKPGSTDKQTVSRLLGSPSSVASFDDSTWYYISQKSQSVAFFKPETLDQKVIAITFDGNGVVRDIKTLDMKDRNELTPVARTTPAPGKELGVFEQLIGNFGRFNNTGGPANRGPGQTPP